MAGRPRKTFTQVVEAVIAQSDVVIEVLDARMIDETRHAPMEEMVHRLGKRLITVINKADLAPREYLLSKKKELENCIFLSTKDRDGVGKLRAYIYQVAAKSKDEQIVVGVVGYPNVGKSSVINSLAGRASAAVSSRSGHTRGKQKIRVSERLQIIDTPGVIPMTEMDSNRLALLSSKNVDQVQDPELVAVNILHTFKARDTLEVIERKFDVKLQGTDAYEWIVQIAKARNRLKAGGVPDIETISRLIIQDWQRGLLK
ncbi:MAG TPA: GTPase [Acidobacteriota bacterium]|nr:GTPase [Acidobacteriota bacterium]